MSGVDKGKYITSVLFVFASGALLNLAVDSRFWHGIGSVKDFWNAIQAITANFQGIPKIWGWITSGATAAAIYVWTFDKFLWKVPILQGWLVRFPNLEGTWVGVLIPRTKQMAPPQSAPADAKRSSVPQWARGKRVLLVHVTIKHEFDKLIFTAKHPNSENVTLAYQLVNIEQAGRTRLYVVYKNVPEYRDGENAAEHKGCCELELHNAEETKSAKPTWRLTGILLDR